MTNWLVRRFIKDYENINDEKVRMAYGFLSGMTGIVCNVLLFAVKFLIGILLHSVAITSDAFNNLSDCLSCVVSLFGYKLASMPADREHPFGHGRMEYISSFIISIIIFIVSYQLLMDSVDKLIHPEELVFSWGLFFILVLSVLLKVWMSKFNKVLGTKLNNTVMLATSQDSLNDVYVTSSTLIALLLAVKFPKIPFDAAAGIILALVIFKVGFEIVRDIIDKLLGTPASKELTESIEQLMTAHPEIIGVHDMIIHDYGPGKQIGSVHAEVSSSMDFLEAHDVIDEAEREIYNKLHVLMTIHLDPVETNNPITNYYRQEVSKILRDIDPTITMHDFRVVTGPTHTNLIFDVLLPYSVTINPTDLKKQINVRLQEYEEKLYAVVTVDREFVEGETNEGN